MTTGAINTGLTAADLDYYEAKIRARPSGWLSTGPEEMDAIATATLLRIVSMARQSLEAIRPTRDAVAWRPMSEAPKGGPNILGLCEHAAREKAVAELLWNGRDWVSAIRHPYMDACFLPVMWQPMPPARADGFNAGVEADETELTWRDLALQFDNHRMNALAVIRCLLEAPVSARATAAEFLKAPPLPGETVLAARIRALRSGEVELATIEALNLANALYQQHYREDAPNWKPFADIRGLLSQIDNMAAGLVRDPHALRPVEPPDPPLPDIERIVSTFADAIGPEYCDAIIAALRPALPDGEVRT